MFACMFFFKSSLTVLKEVMLLQPTLLKDMKVTIKSYFLVYYCKFVEVCIPIFYMQLKRFGSLWMWSLLHESFIVKYSQRVYYSCFKVLATCERY